MTPQQQYRKLPTKEQFAILAATLVGLTLFLVFTGPAITLNVCIGLLFGSGTLLYLTIKQNRKKAFRE